jgi:ubiquinone/menaquinone biosynthesis C-methylase UbiE
MAETPGTVPKYTFDPFARHQFYIDINAALVRRAISRVDATRPRAQRLCVVELASGTGAVTEQILDEVERCGRHATLVAVEPSLDALAVARERLQGRDVMFVQGDADQLVDVVSQADAVFFCNAIHLVRDKRDVLGKLAHVLAPDGYLACNSTFFDGAYAPGSERAYQVFMRKALHWLRRHYPEVRLVRREKADTLQWLTAEQYVALAEEHGLCVVEQELEVAQMPLQAWQDIGSYSLFIEGALPGVPIPIGAEALSHAAAETFAELDVDSIPRIWLQLLLQRTASLPPDT